MNPIYLGTLYIIQIIYDSAFGVIQYNFSNYGKHHTLIWPWSMFNFDSGKCEVHRPIPGGVVNQTVSIPVDNHEMVLTLECMTITGPCG